jgi:hypothetical protein
MPIQRWRYPVALRAKTAVMAAAGITLAKVFFPLWFAIPVMAVLAVWGLWLCAVPPEVRVDPGAGLLTMRIGPVIRRVKLASVMAVQVDRAKVSIARSDGWEISVYAWRKSRLDGLLRAPVVAGEVAHAISKAAAAAEDGQAGAATRPGRPSRWPRRHVAPLLLACVGLLAVAAAQLVRVSWPSPLMTAIGAILALALGIGGILNVLASCWLLLSERAARGRKRAA